MRRPRNRRRARRGTAPNPSERTSRSSNRKDLTSQIERSQLRPRDVRPDEFPELRAIFWRQAGRGHCLPAEIDVIVIEGGAG